MARKELTTIKKRKKMKLRISIAILTALSFSGCTSPSSLLSTPQTKKAPERYKNYEHAPDYKKEAFGKAQHAVGLSTKNDPKYKSFRPILTDEETRKWFSNNMYLLWDRQITRNQYIAQSTSRFPAYKYEFTFIANHF